MTCSGSDCCLYSFPRESRLLEWIRSPYLNKSQRQNLEIAVIAVSWHCRHQKNCDCEWMIGRVLFRDISLRCIRKSIDRLELIGKRVLWPIRFFVETNLILKKSTNPVCLCARQRLAHLHCQGPSWRLLTSNQSVKISVPRVSTLYMCAHFVSISGVWVVGCIIYLWADTSVSNGAQNKAPLLVKFNQEKLESWAKETLMVPQVHSLGRKTKV